jgi:hypothetical protein
MRKLLDLGWEIKEKFCYIALDFDQEVEIASQSPSVDKP